MSSFTDPITATALMAAYKQIIKTKDPYVKVCQVGDDISKWYIMFHSLGDSLTGGEYIFRLEAQPDYPYSAPKFYAMTPNAIVELEKEICIHVGHFHKTDFVAAGLNGFTFILLGLITQIGTTYTPALTELQGINILKTSKTQIAAAARASVDYNNNHLTLVKTLIESSYEQYSKQWNKQSKLEQLRAKMKK
jgi:ubiquitin-protein ligase